MNPVRIEGATHSLGRPSNWDEQSSGHCSVLWVRAEHVDGLQFLRSAWEATTDQIGLMLAGAKVQLGICGSSHPVVNLGLGPAPADYLPPAIIEQTVHHGVRAVRVAMFFPCGQRVRAEASIGDDGLGGAVKVAIEEIERFAREVGWL